MSKKHRKPVLIIVGEKLGIESFSYSKHWISLSSRYFNFEFFDPGKNYDKSSTFLVMGKNYYGNTEFREQFLKERKVIVDLFFEGQYGKWGTVYKDILYPHHLITYGSYSPIQLKNAVFCPNFFWYDTALAFFENNYDKHIPSRNFVKKFLMPIGSKRSWRDHVVNELQPFLKNAYWSYQSRGTNLPDDLEIPVSRYYDTRWLNFKWFNETFFTIIVESITGGNITDEIPVFITEKTWKPVAGQHPFMVIGGNGILSFLKTQGFETFDNLFDESYDKISNIDKKLQIIINNIKNFKEINYDKITLDKVEHNFNKFYNMQEITKEVEENLVAPLYRYINSTI